MTMNYPRTLLLGGLLLTAAGPALAQRKLNNSWQERTEAQLELARSNGDFMWGSLHAQHSIGNLEPLFQTNWVQAGYEHFWSERWSGGGNVRVLLDRAARQVTAYGQPELLLRHRSPVAGLTFGQRLGVGYLLPGRLRPGLGTARLRLDLERLLPVGEKLQLRPRLAYEAGLNIRLQSSEDQRSERRVDEGTWRAEVGLRFSDWFDLTPYVARQTGYFIFIEQFDVNGNQVGGGPTNVRTPVVGLDLRYTLFQGGTPFERKNQLPTQH